MQYETVIGLEVHVQLSTESKLFSGSATKFGAEPNTQANIFDLAMPGTLPVLNEKAVAMAVKFGVAIGAEIGKHSVFDRKNYFYPDLPKGYQVSQLDYPTVGKGTLTVTLDDGSEKVIGVTRAHMEEDAGKSLHEDYQGDDGNRPQPRRYAAARNSLRARPTQRERSGCLFEKAALDHPLPRHF